MLPVGLGHAVRLDVGVPVLLPAVALSTHLALERLQAQVLVHVLLQVLRLVETLITADTHTHTQKGKTDQNGCRRTHFYKVTLQTSTPSLRTPSSLLHTHTHTHIHTHTHTHTPLVLTGHRRSL